MDTPPDAETRLFIEQNNKGERTISDGKYADKLVERIVFWVAATAGTAIISIIAAKYL